ncbi:hypothetical protein PIB30_074893, partial [Stylosanthes scabra]|nr:hypothetical protein [Stylosanthes scabra]
MFCADGWERDPPRMQVLGLATKRMDTRRPEPRTAGVVPEKALRRSTMSSCVGCLPAPNDYFEINSKYGFSMTNVMESPKVARTIP